jgi:hypothetical protein
MGHSAGHHIEHAEHAAHAAHDTFNTRVTLTIAIIAAGLAGVTILGHRAHNMMLAKQLEASLYSSQSFNKWAQYQAYNVRSHLYQVASEEAVFSASNPGTEEIIKKAKARWDSQVAKYEGKLMPKTQEEAEKFDKKSAEMLEAAHDYHFKAEWLDLGDLGLQLGVVLASLAILTKRRAFWILGIVSAVIGLSIAMGAQFGVIRPSDAHHGDSHGEHSSTTDHGKGHDKTPDAHEHKKAESEHK